MKKYKLSTIVVTVALLQSAVFANTLTGGDFTVGSNWSEGSTPTDPLDPGIIDSSVTDGTWAANPASGLAIQQTGGDVSRSTFGWQDFSGMNYEMTGGTFTAGSFGLRLQDSSVFTMSGGTLSMGTALNNVGSTFTMTGGTLSGNNLQFNNSTFNFNGGVVNLGSGGFSQSGKSSGTATVNFSGNVDFNTSILRKGNGTAVNFTIGAGAGTIDTDTIASDGLTFNWITGSDFSLTATTIDSGSSWEDLWNAGKLNRDGSQSGTFADNFDVTGSTLTVVPEPATLGLVASAGVLLMVFRRRMMK